MAEVNQNVVEYVTGLVERARKAQNRRRNTRKS